MKTRRLTRVRARTRLALASLGGAVIVGVCGCGADPVCDIDPAVQFPDDECGIFVSSSRGDDGNDGSHAHPVKTLARATQAAKAGPPRIYACAEEFNERFELFSIDLWGGFDCGNGWTYRGREAKTVVTGDDSRLGSVFTNQKERTTTLANVRIVSSDEPGDRVPIPLLVVVRFPARMVGVQLVAGRALRPGGASIALHVAGDAVPRSTLELLDSEIIAADATDGAPGYDKGVAGDDGDDGRLGIDACSSDAMMATPAFTSECDDGTLLVGGEGGAGLSDRGDPGADGLPLPVPNEMQWGAGGIGQLDTPCTDGHPGLPGAEGEPGRGAKGPAALGEYTSTFHQVNNGADGTPGKRGQGGGGGGGSRGGALLCGAGPKGGAAGGSGGSGGCGGNGATGGTAGGISVGINIEDANVTIRRTVIQIGNGGRGGAGAPRPEPVYGGRGAEGGAGADGALPGCRGGDGGTGGAGGPGGGGLGGASIGILHLDTDVVNPNDIDVTFRLGTAGKGGLGGDPSLPESAGEDGVRAEILPLARVPNAL